MGGALSGGEIAVAADGVANLETGVEMTADTLYLTGSITKVWLTTALTGLVGEGVLDWDVRVIDLLPDFRVSDHEMTQVLTLRHLLTHSSGLDAGDHIQDCGSNPDNVERYVRSLAACGRLHDPGAYVSYCNAGFVLAARMAEAVTGQGWEQIVRERVLEPLGLARAGFGPEHGILHRTAVGHFPGTAGYRRTDTWMLPAAMGPAGATLLVDVAASLEFAKLHLEDPALAAMREPQLPFPAAPSRQIGLGWFLQDGVASHTGGSLGGFANLFIVPEQGVAGAVFVNGSGLGAVAAVEFQDLLLERLAGRPTPERPLPAPVADDLERYAGRYERCGARSEVKVEGDHLLVTTRVAGPLAAYAGAAESTAALQPAGGGRFIPVGTPNGLVAELAAVDFLDGEFMYSGLRLARRVA